MMICFLSQVDLCGQDSLYIQPFSHQRFSLSSFIDYKFLTISYMRNEERITYAPNAPYQAGIRYSRKNSIFNLGIGVQLPFAAEEDIAKTKSFDLQIHKYGKGYLLDAYYQKYKGFYLNQNDSVTTFPDMRAQLIGTSWHYFINKDQFSARAAYEQTERQVKSAGSIVAGFMAFYHSLQGIAASDTILSSSRQVHFGLNVGYAYTYCFNDEWQASAILLVGLEHAHILDHSQNSFISQIKPFVSARGTFGYSKERWSFRIIALVNDSQLRNETNIEQYITFGRGRFAITRRF